MAGDILKRSFKLCKLHVTMNRRLADNARATGTTPAHLQPSLERECEEGEYVDLAY